MASAVPVTYRQGIFFSCYNINYIPTTVFKHPNGYMDKVSLIEWTKVENGENNCHKVSLELELAFRNNSIKYIIPGYSKTGSVVLCKSIRKKAIPTKENICQGKDILIHSTTKLDANQYLEAFYRIAFSAYRQSPIKESPSALQYDNNNEPYIDIAEAINQSSVYKITK
jgi:hypothetical protein